jgi:murein L,D-transpeptidase YafK
MKQIFSTLFIFFFSCQNTTNLGQLPRIERAYLEKETFVLKTIASKNIQPNELEIFIRVFKKEQTLEVWGKNQQDSTFQKLTDYPFCAFSGDLGPKRKEGDLQIPEGIYHINRFNPKSKFHLSLGLNYPNKSDKILSDKNAPGSDIFIHGGCQTVGCIPLTDDKIREVWVFSEMAKNNGQSKIPVHIFPFKMTEALLKSHLKKRQNLNAFWQNLKPIYEAFEKKKKLNAIQVSVNGRYELI